MDTTLRSSDFMFQIRDFCIRSSFHLSKQVRQLVLAAQSVVEASLSLATKAADPSELPFTRGKYPQMVWPFGRSESQLVTERIRI